MLVLLSGDIGDMADSNNNCTREIQKFPEKNISINLTANSLKNKYFSSWLKFKLLELSSSARKQAFYEIHENEVLNFDPLIKKALCELQASVLKGCVNYQQLF